VHKKEDIELVELAIYHHGRGWLWIGTDGVTWCVEFDILGLSDASVRADCIGCDLGTAAACIKLHA
jgi:hypothetical protein